MGMSVDALKLAVEVGADASQALRELRDFDRKQHNIMAGVASSGASSFGLLNSAGSAAFHGLQATASAAFSAIKIGGTVALGAISAAFAATVKTGVSFAASMEQAQIGFTSMMGSADMAAGLLNDLRDFAKATPFEMEGVIQGARRLMAMGTAAGDVIPLMTSVGNAVAAMGGNAEMIDRVTMALGQMQAKGKVSAEEMLQLAEAGIPAWDFLSRKLGVDVPTAMKQVEQGAVSAQTFIAAFMEGSAAKFGNAMEDQSKSLLGMWSSFVDTAKIKLGELTGQPIADRLKEVFPAISQAAEGLLDRFAPIVGKIGVLAIDAFEGILPTLESWGGKIADTLDSIIGKVDLSGLGGMFGNVLSLIGPLVEMLAPVLNLLAAAKDIIREIFGVVGEAIRGLSPVVSQLASALLPVFGELGRIVADVLAQVGPALVGLLGTVGRVLATIGPPIVELFGTVLKVLGPVIAAFAEALTPVLLELAPIFARLIEAVIPLVEPLGQLVEAALLAATAFGGDLLVSLADLAVTVAEKLVPPLITLIEWLTPLMDVLIPIAGTIFGVVKAFAIFRTALMAFQAVSMMIAGTNPLFLALAAIGGVVFLIIKNWDTIKEWVGKLWEWLGNAAGKFLEVGKKILGALWDGLKWVWDKIWWWNVELPLKILDALWQGLQKLWDLGKAAFSWLWDGIRWVWDQLWHWLVERPAQVLQMLFDGFGRLWDAGMHLIRSIWNGIVAAWDWFIGQVARIGGWIWDTIWNNLKGIWQIGVDLLHGLWDGIVSVKDWIIDKIKGLGRSIINGFKSIFGISSPSTVFARQGMHMMEGLAAGISGGAQLPADALARVSRGLTADASMTFAAGGIAGGVGSAGGRTAAAGAAPQITVIVQGSIVDRDGLARAVDDAVARLGRRTSTLQMSGVV